ncbi:MAG: uroporphyrinogen decarboxylase family protein, partial [Atribacterota bacterium]
DEDERTFTVREIDGGVVRLSKKDPTNMPQFLQYPVPDRKAWDEFKLRYHPISPNRFLPGWETISNTDFQRNPEFQGKPWSERDFPLGVAAISLFGIFRDMMGLRGISYALYDDRVLIEEMMNYMVEFSLVIFQKIFDAGIHLDFVNLWEDMCYKVGLLISPKIVKEMMVPRYRILTDFLRNHGVDIFMLDCDGNVSELVPLLLEGGVNGIFPMEVQADMDPVAFRKEYGKDLIIAGGIDKRALTHGKKEVDEELKKIPWLLEQGGYFPIVDHLVPPDVPLENYLYMMERLQDMRTTG